MEMSSKGKFVYTIDSEGNGGKLYERDGMKLHVFRDTVEECDKLFDEIKDFKPRRDDVWICAFGKSGTHWLWEVVSMLLMGADDLLPVPKEGAMLENSYAETLESLPSPRVLNTHHFCDVMPAAIWNTRYKIIHPMRNIKDIHVSMYHHFKGLGFFKGSFETYMEMRGEDSTNDWLRYEEDWFSKHGKNPNVLFLHYEDMVKDPVQMVKNVAAFLDVPVTEDRVALVADKTSLKNMKANKVEHGPNGKVVQGVFYRKGQPGDWKNYFTVAMNERFDNDHMQQLKDLGMLYD